MQLPDIAWASLRRRPGRLAFMLIGLALGIGTVVALVSLSRAMQSEVADELDRFGANIVVTPKSTALDVAYGGMSVAGLTVDTRELRTADAALIRTIPNKRNVAAVAPKLIGGAEIEGRKVLLIGANFRQESGIKSWWRLEGELATSADEVMLGSEAAAVLKKRTGDTVMLGRAPRRVTAVIAPNGSLDDQAVLADLALVQTVLGKPDAVSLIEVSALCRGCPIEDIVQQIAQVLPHARVAPIRQAVAAREKAVRQFTRFSYAVSLVVLLVGVLVVMSTMMSSVAERTQEIGILRAIGFRQRQVASVVFIEALVVNLVAGVAGWLLGTGAARWAGPAIGQLSSVVPFDARLGGIAIALAIVLGAVGGAYPALRAARMDPSQALRHF